MKTFLTLIILAIVGVTAWYLYNNYKPGQVVTLTTTNTDTVVVVKDSIINANTFDTVPLGFVPGHAAVQNLRRYSTHCYVFTGRGIYDGRTELG